LSVNVYTAIMAWTYVSNMRWCV